MPCVVSEESHQMRTNCITNLHWTPIVGPLSDYPQNRFYYQHWTSGVTSGWIILRTDFSVISQRRNVASEYFLGSPLAAILGTKRTRINFPCTGDGHDGAGLVGWVTRPQDGSDHGGLGLLLGPGLLHPRHHRLLQVLRARPPQVSKTPAHWLLLTVRTLFPWLLLVMLDMCRPWPWVQYKCQQALHSWVPLRHLFVAWKLSVFRGDWGYHVLS
jgi:hypothetical protein